MLTTKTRTTEKREYEKLEVLFDRNQAIERKIQAGLNEIVTRMQQLGLKVVE